VTVSVLFDYNQEHWSHDFQIVKGSTVSDLKQSMVNPASPPDDRMSFDLCKRRLRLSNLDTVDADDTLEFKYLGPEEGRRLFERDKDVRAREEEAARLSREQERQRQEAERQRREEMARQRAEEEQRRTEQEAEVGRKEPEVSSPAEDRQKAAVVTAPLRVTPLGPPQAKASHESQPTAKTDPAFMWIWTQKGVEAISEAALMYGNPEPKTPFTGAHLQQVRMHNPGGKIDHESLSRDGYISFGTPVAPTPAKQVVTASPKTQEVHTSVTVTHKDSRESIVLAMPTGQTVLDLKKAISSQVHRGPSSKLTVTYKTGKLLGDMTKLDGLSAEDRESLLASGLDLGPPAAIELRIFHASKTSSGTSVTVDAEDTATFQEVKKALCDKFDAKTTEVRLVTKKPGATGFLFCKDSDRLQGMREVGAVGKLMDRLAAGDIHPVEQSKLSPSSARNGKAASIRGAVSVEVVHAKHGSTVIVQVPPTSTVLQLRQAIMKAIGQTEISEVQIVRVEGSELVPEPDSGVLNGRSEIMMLGCHLPNPP